jgi:hypothetical protein
VRLSRGVAVCGRAIAMELISKFRDADRLFLGGEAPQD